MYQALEKTGEGDYPLGLRHLTLDDVYEEMWNVPGAQHVTVTMHIDYGSGRPSDIVIEDMKLKNPDYE